MKENSSAQPLGTPVPVESLLDEDDFAILREEYESQEGLYAEMEIFDA